MPFSQHGGGSWPSHGAEGSASSERGPRPRPLAAGPPEGHAGGGRLQTGWGGGASKGQHEGGIWGTGASCPMAVLQAQLFALLTLTVSNTQTHRETKCWAGSSQG